MNILTLITALIVLGIVWGGLAFFIIRAVKFEKFKIENGKEES